MCGEECALHVVEGICAAGVYLGIALPISSSAGQGALCTECPAANSSTFLSPARLSSAAPLWLVSSIFSSEAQVTWWPLRFMGFLLTQFFIVQKHCQALWL